MSRPGAAPRDLSWFGRAELARLAREYLLAGHLIDRAGMPQVVGRYGLEPMRDIAIAEWMGASPVYTRRMQRLLGFEGDDVATIFKGMQFDIGAPHEFLDFRYRVHDATHGEFHLDHCGALMDVEPMGEDFVVAMCHHIEDPTFDATACATNARARVRPIHRPPRVPADRHPHCHWTVEIRDDAAPVPEPAPAVVIATTEAARLPLPAIDDEPGSGFADYRRALDPDLQLEDFSAPALRAIIDELCLQGHLLTMSFLLAIEARHGLEAALDLGERQFVGIAGLAASRLAAELGADEGDPVSGIAEVLSLHPALHPRSYVGIAVEPPAGPDDRLTLSLTDCPAVHEGRPSWIGLLADGHDRALTAMVAAVDPRASCRAVAPRPGAVASWEVVIGDEPAPEMDEVVLARFSTGADWVFRS